MLSATINGERVEGVISFTHTDPGGCETCSLELSSVTNTPPKAGSTIVIYDAAQPLWLGVVEEPGRSSGKGSSDTIHVGGVGKRTDLSRGRLAMIYLDPALASWGDPKTARRVVLSTSNYSLGSVQTAENETLGPVLSLEIDGAWTATTRPIVEATYDAGENCLVGYFTGTWARLLGVDNVDTQWTWDVYFSGDDLINDPKWTSGNLRALGPSKVSQVNPVPSRFLKLRLFYNFSGNAGTDNARYVLIWAGVCVVGDHGLTLKTNDDGTLSIDASAIVADVVERSGMLCSTDIDQGSFDVRSLAYKTPVAYQSITDDIVKLTAWHFGVWPGTILEAEKPLVLFKRPPERPTATVDFTELESPDITERFSGMNSYANVSYTLADGQPASVKVTRQHPALVDGDGGTLDVDAGLVGSKLVAQTYGLYALAIDQAQSRASGSVTLPGYVRRPGGGRIRSSHLRPGVDRLQITGVFNGGPVLADAPERVDSFRISRMSVEETDGRVKTTVELDQGADLIEVLQARFATADSSGVLSSG